MKIYYVNKEAQYNGDHEVHQEGCIFIPANKEYLGEHETCKTAVAVAKLRYEKSNGCYTCCRACHTT